MPRFICGKSTPEASTVASEAFSRSWHFIERDPVLAGHDRETLQVELVLRIQHLMSANESERDPLRIANLAIGRVREEMQAAAASISGGGPADRGHSRYGAAGGKKNRALFLSQSASSEVDLPRMRIG